MKCSCCGDDVSSCEECGDSFEEGDKIKCWTIGRHFHKDCGYMSSATAKEIKGVEK